jgi:hypothetical protein
MSQPSEHDRYVAKLNSLIEAGRDDLIDEVVAEHALSAASGRDAFWRTTRPGGWFTRSLLDAGDAPGDSAADGEDAVLLRLSLDLADQWDRRDLLRD